MVKIPTQTQYIQGQYISGGDRETFETRNPATGEVIAKVDEATDADIEHAVQSAIEGQKEWARFSGTQRSRVLRKAVAILRARNQELAELETLDTGKPIQETECVDVESGADSIEYFAGLAPSLGGEHVNLGSSFFYTIREPLGVCAGIGAWNYPLQIACWKSGPALACGNAMIFKPSEETPLSALRLAEIYTEAGLPDGVFNVVQGKARVGRALVEHERIEKVSLTGAVETGKKIMASAAKTLKHVTMELGGKSPLIIFADSDLDEAVSAALMANFYSQGEICSNGTRVFVESTIHDEFLKRLVARTSTMKIGDPMNPEIHVGALINPAHLEKVLGYIEKGKEEGAVLAYGGNRVEIPGMEQGSFLEPTIFTSCSDAMTIVRDEIFGPVMSVLKFDTEDEVVRRANDTELGLAAGVFTQDLQRGHRVVAALEAGTCWINNYNITPVEMPFGGYKQSGIGRENGTAAIEHYTQLKSIYVEMDKVDAPY